MKIQTDHFGKQAIRSPVTYFQMRTWMWVPRADRGIMRTLATMMSLGTARLSVPCQTRRTRKLVHHESQRTMTGLVLSQSRGTKAMVLTITAWGQRSVKSKKVAAPTP